MALTAATLQSSFAEEPTAVVCRVCSLHDTGQSQALFAAVKPSEQLPAALLSWGITRSTTVLQHCGLQVKERACICISTGCKLTA